MVCENSIFKKIQTIVIIMKSLFFFLWGAVMAWSGTQTIMKENAKDDQLLIYQTMGLLPKTDVLEYDYETVSIKDFVRETYKDKNLLFLDRTQDTTYVVHSTFDNTVRFNRRRDSKIKIVKYNGVKCLLVY